MCQRYYVRERTCSAEFLSALIDVRAELDMPPGTADEVKTMGHDAVVALARPDWERDSQQPRIDAICTAIATRTPAARVDRLLAEGEACAATTGCTTFARCAVATQRSYIASGAGPH